jgi:acyl-coenzyme A synthetase/AMP-(fatty) acid ligase
MSDFKSALEPFNLEAALWADRGGGCLVVDVSGRTEHGQYVASLKQVTEQVDYYLHHANAPTFAATKLYVVGDWTSVGEAEDEELTGAIKQDLEVSHRCGRAYLQPML